ncbi:MAG: GntR family transcriptional regulator [Solirubrobacterales bacterium]
MSPPPTPPGPELSLAPPPLTTPQHALEGLRRAIVSGELRPGSRVLQEDVAAQLGVSVASVREALTVLEQEGQMTYRPRRGYFVTELHVADLEEIYDLRRVLETRAVRLALPLLDDAALQRMRDAALMCADAVGEANILAELEANRRFHFSLLEIPDQPHSMRLVRLLWDSTEPYRALYYNSARERRRSLDAHDRIIAAVGDRDVERVIAELDEHRGQALTVLREILSEPEGEVR